MEPNTTALEEWKAIRVAWESLLYLAKELGGYTTYLSHEQRRDLERIQEDIRALERGIRKL